MSEFTRELIPILFMYGFVLLLGPFIGFAMWMAFEGDRPTRARRSQSARHVGASSSSSRRSSRSSVAAIDASSRSM